MKLPLVVLPMTLQMVAGGLVAAKRLGTYLHAEELQGYVVRTSLNSMEKSEKKSIIDIQNATLTWGTQVHNNEVEDDNARELELAKDGEDENLLEKDKSKDRFTLNIPKFSVQEKSLSVIMGPVGSGKSSFLSSILGEMWLADNEEGKVVGTVRASGSVTYCAQEPWIQNLTVKDNILFGNELDEERYNAVISCCALEADMKVKLACLLFRA